MGDTTDISQLPDDLNAPFPPLAPTPTAADGKLNQEQMSQLINGLQQAMLSGNTLLPSAHIPMNTTPYTQDPNSVANHIPTPMAENNNPVKYIPTEELPTELQKMHSMNLKSNLNLYDTLQIPVLIVLLYFLFQLPFLKRQIQVIFPKLFGNDGNFNIYGLVFTSCLYGTCYTMLQKLLEI